MSAFSTAFCRHLLVVVAPVMASTSGVPVYHILSTIFSANWAYALDWLFKIFIVQGGKLTPS